MWQTIHEHDPVAERFRIAAERGRISGTYLLVGPEGIGKRSLAIQLAKTLLCLDNEPGKLFHSCNTCPSCILVDAGNHPDLHTVAKRPDRQTFTIDLLIGEQNHRHREGLLIDLALKPSLSSRKVAIIDDADLFNIESANSLLKTLEEPPPGAVLFLIGTSQNRQLPTIRSRSQIIRFRPLSDAVVADLLVARGVLSDPHQAAEVAAAAGGSIRRAMEMADPELWRFRAQLFQWLARSQPDRLRIVRAVTQCVDSAGADAPARRVRLQQLVRFAIDFYRGAMRSGSGGVLEGDPVLRAAIAELEIAGMDMDRILDRLDCCLETLTYIARNANLATLIEWWIDELARP